MTAVLVFIGLIGASVKSIADNDDDDMPREILVFLKIN